MRRRSSPTPPSDEEPLSRKDAALILQQLALRSKEIEASGIPVPTPGERAYMRDLFPHQATAAADKSKRKVYDPGRRGGKTTLLAREALDAAETFPESIVPYYGITRRSAKLYIWPELIRINDRHHLGIDFNHTELTATLQNKSQIIILGASNQADIQKARGIRIARAILDEAQAGAEFYRELLFDVLEPATVDYDADIIMAGTPGAVPAGPFFEACNNVGEFRGWSHHNWTIFDNPFIKAKEAVARIMERHGWTTETPTYVREYLGRWILDTSALVFPYDEAKNSYLGDLPPSPRWIHALGVDVGFDDRTTFTVVSWSPDYEDLFAQRSKGRSGMIPYDVAQEINRLREAFKGFRKIVVDEGGLGKMIAEEFRTRYRIPCEQAEKSRKPDAIELIKGDMRAGRVKIHRTEAADLISEMRVLQWDPERPGKEDEKFANDYCDSWIYAYRAADHYRYERKQPRPAPGSHAAIELEMDEHLEERSKELQDQKRGGSIDPMFE